MKSIATLLFTLLFLTGCKKFIENQQEQAALEVVTSGRWKVTQYKKGSQALTSSFNNYQFQFQPNQTVEALKDSVLQLTGSWRVNVENRTITSGFQTTATPLVLLNGTWTITNSSLTTVAATQTTDGEIRTLKLAKL